MESKYKSVVIFIAGVTKRRYPITGMLFTCLLAIMFVNSEGVEAQPTVVDPRLDVRTVVSGLSSPTTMAFLGDDDILVLEKETGKGAAGNEWNDTEHGAGFAGQLWFGEGAFVNCTTSRLSNQPRRLSILDGEHNRQRFFGAQRDSVARKPSGPLHLGRFYFDVASEYHQAPRASARCHQSGRARQS